MRIFAAVDSCWCFCDCNCGVPINCCNNSGVATMEFDDRVTVDDDFARLLLGSVNMTRFGRLFDSCFEVSSFLAVIVRDGGGGDASET